MRTPHRIATALTLTIALSFGCRGSGEKTGHNNPHQAAGQAEHGPDRRAVFTAQNNPTTNDGRGQPSLDDFFAPAAWVYIDGHPGKFLERDGRPQVHWFIQQPVSSSPTFRGEAYGPLLGRPDTFKCTLDSIETADGSSFQYGIMSEPGAFETGRDYALRRPGPNFTVRNRQTGDVVEELPPLPPGKYLMAAGLKNSETGKEGLAITQFTVAE